MIRLLVPILLFPALLNAAALPVGDFSREGLTGWEEQTFRGRKKTVYRIVTDGGERVVEARSRGGASGMIRRIEVDPSRWRYLTWRWKVAGIIPAGDERTRKGDDYAARLYLVFPGGFLRQPRALVYVWANRLPKGGALPNPYTSRAMVLAVESGNGRAGHWVTETRDVVADFRRLFGTDPPRLGAVAIMTDSDDTGGEAAAWYGDIRFMENISSSP